MKSRPIYAFAQGCWERLTLGDSFGRTHETSQDWNEAYDRGANLADWLTRDSDGVRQDGDANAAPVPKHRQARPSPKSYHNPTPSQEGTDK